MNRTKILILTQSSELKTEIQQLLSNHADIYLLFHQEEFSDSFNKYDITFLDEDLIHKNPKKYLAQHTFELFPSSVIYLTNHIDGLEEYAAVKSLTADYLYKNQLTESSVHNCIRYTLESKRLRSEIENHQKRYQSLFFKSVDAAFFLSADWKIENINQSFSDLFGVEPRDIEKSDFSRLFNEQTDFLGIVSSFENKHESSIDIELKLNKLSKTGFYLSRMRISALRETSDQETGLGIITGYHGTITNISDKKRRNTIKESTTKIAQTYRLARILAHEIRNPLTNITLAINQLEDEIPKNEETIMYVGIIERCTKRIDLLIEQLLKSSEQQQLKNENCDLIGLLNTVIENAEDRADLIGISVKTDFEAEAKSYFCDGQKLQMAFSNIVTNAIESLTGKEGHVIVGTYFEDDYICVYVEDNGKGMDDDQKKKIYDPFYTNKKNGVGLGMTDTLSIISEHNGHIEIDSEENLGTTFTIYLPLEKEKIENH